MWRAPSWRLGASFFILGAGALCADATTNVVSPAAPNLTSSQTDEKARQTLVENLTVAANPCVFSGPTFPAIDFSDHDLVTHALGPYTVTVRYFDACWHEVTQPGVPGRYGALATFQFPSGVRDTRQVTLYHTSPEYSSAHDYEQAQIQFPRALALPSDVESSEAWNVDQYVDRSFYYENRRDDGPAKFLSGLHDISADPARWRGFECWFIDGRWWDGLEKQLGLEVPYQRTIRLPAGYDAAPQKKWPLLLFLHGSGERGDDISVLKKWGPGGYADAGHPLPFIIVTPQCRPRHRWNPELLMQMLAGIEQAYRVDLSRLYVTGLSLGGMGSLELAATARGHFAAVACLSGREDPEIAQRLKDEPVWLFHGELDETVPTHDSVELAAALKKVGAPVRLTLFPKEGHGGWEKVYADPALYSWFLQQHL